MRDYPDENDWYWGMLNGFGWPLGAAAFLGLLNSVIPQMSHRKGWHAAMDVNFLAFCAVLIATVWLVCRTIDRHHQRSIAADRERRADEALLKDAGRSRGGYH